MSLLQEIEAILTEANELALTLDINSNQGKAMSFVINDILIPLKNLLTSGKSLIDIKNFFGERLKNVNEFESNVNRSKPDKYTDLLEQKVFMLKWVEILRAKLSSPENFWSILKENTDKRNLFNINTVYQNDPNKLYLLNSEFSSTLFSIDKELTKWINKTQDINLLETPYIQGELSDNPHHFVHLIPLNTSVEKFLINYRPKLKETYAAFSSKKKSLQQNTSKADRTLYTESVASVTTATTTTITPTEIERRIMPSATYSSVNSDSTYVSRLQPNNILSTSMAIPIEKTASGLPGAMQTTSVDTITTENTEKSLNISLELENVLAKDQQNIPETAVLSTEPVASVTTTTATTPTKVEEPEEVTVYPVIDSSVNSSSAYVISLELDNTLSASVAIKTKNTVSEPVVSVAVPTTLAAEITTENTEKPSNTSSENLENILTKDQQNIPETAALSTETVASVTTTTATTTTPTKVEEPEEATVHPVIDSSVNLSSAYVTSLEAGNTLSASVAIPIENTASERVFPVAEPTTSVTAITKENTEEPSNISSENLENVLTKEQQNILEIAALSTEPVASVTTATATTTTPMKVEKPEEATVHLVIDSSVSERVFPVAASTTLVTAITTENTEESSISPLMSSSTSTSSSSEALVNYANFSPSFFSTPNESLSDSDKFALFLRGLDEFSNNTQNNKVQESLDDSTEITLITNENFWDFLCREMESSGMNIDAISLNESVYDINQRFTTTLSKVDKKIASWLKQTKDIDFALPYKSRTGYNPSKGGTVPAEQTIEQFILLYQQFLPTTFQTYKHLMEDTIAKTHENTSTTSSTKITFPKSLGNLTNDLRSIINQENITLDNLNDFMANILQRAYALLNETTIPSYTAIENPQSFGLNSLVKYLNVLLTSINTLNKAIMMTGEQRTYATPTPQREEEASITTLKYALRNLKDNQYINNDIIDEALDNIEKLVAALHLQHRLTSQLHIKKTTIECLNKDTYISIFKKALAMMTTSPSPQPKTPTQIFSEVMNELFRQFIHHATNASNGDVKNNDAYSVSVASSAAQGVKIVLPIIGSISETAVKGADVVGNKRTTNHYHTLFLTLRAEGLKSILEETTQYLTESLDKEINQLSMISKDKKSISFFEAVINRFDKAQHNLLLSRKQDLVEKFAAFIAIKVIEYFTPKGNKTFEPNTNYPNTDVIRGLVEYIISIKQSHLDNLLEKLNMLTKVTIQYHDELKEYTMLDLLKKGANGIYPKIDQMNASAVFT